jgi:RimJ/RimL family protein N-acetyltransferase
MTFSQSVVRPLTVQDQGLLESMYRTFTPVGATQGLPPSQASQRSRWLAKLRQGINLVVFRDNRVAGHLALMPIGDAAELTCFVHQDFRRQGLATALLAAAVREGDAAGYSALSILISADNVAARRGLRKFGFQPVWEDTEAGEYVYPLRESLLGQGQEFNSWISR